MALGVISNIRDPIHPDHRLQVGKSRRRTQRTRESDQNRKLRQQSRELYEDLSKYYPLPRNRSIWRTWDLVFEGKDECDHSILR